VRSLYAILTSPLSLRVQLILCLLSHTILDILGDNLLVSIRVHGDSQSARLLLLGAIREVMSSKNVNPPFVLFPTVQELRTFYLREGEDKQKY
jgi:hypothetical protein